MNIGSESQDIYSIPTLINQSFQICFILQLVSQIIAPPFPQRLHFQQELGGQDLNVWP